MKAWISTPALQAHPALMMLRAAGQWRRNDARRWALRLYSLMTVLVFSLPAAAALAWLQPRAAWASIAALAVAGLCTTWAAHITVLLRLDHPHAAHTVPGHARAVRSAALGLWAALVALMAGAAGLGAAALELGDARTCWHITLTTALGAGALLLLLAAALRWWWLWVVLSVAPALLGVRAARHGLLDAWAWAQPLWLAQPLGSSLLLLALMGLMLGAMFGGGGAAHARAYRRSERWRRAAAQTPAGPKAGLAVYGRWGEWAVLPLQRLSDAWLRRCLARARPGEASVMARAEVVLHGLQHWLRQLAVLLFVQLCVGFSLLLTAWLTGLGLDLFLQHGRLGISIGVAIMAFSAVMSLPCALWASRREQALLLLLPGMPQGAALNHALARRQARHCLVLWAALLPAVAGLLWVGLAPHKLAFIATALPLSAWLWRDHARMPSGRGFTTFAAYGLCVLLGLPSMWLLSRYPAALGPWALGLLLLTAALLAWRWRVLARLPQALPVGRLA